MMKIKIPRHIDKHIFVQATEWQARLWSDQASSEDLAQCQQWRQQHPHHEQAWQILISFNQRFASIPKTQQQLLNPSQAQTSDWIKGGSALLCILAIGYVLWQQQLFALWLSDHRTGRAEVKQLQLADGTQLVLAANSALNINYANGQRQIELIKGKVLVETGHKDPTLGPLQVWHQHLQVQPIGTKFTVAAQQQQVNIAVYQGKVQIQSDHLARFALPAGWQVSFDLNQAQPHRFPSDDLQLAWIKHKLVAEQMPLCQFLKQLAEYHSSYIMCDSALEAYKISGTYSLDRNDEILQQLPQLFPIQIKSYGHYFIKASPQP